MRRRNFLLTALLVLAALSCAAGGLAVLLKREPDFYTAAGAEGDDDPAQAAAVLTRLGDFRNDVQREPAWGATFTAAELNAFLREHLADGEGLAGLLPAGLNSPRVTIEGDRLKVAGRYGHGAWSTVLSVELRAWLVTKEVNAVAVELCGMWAGAVPVGSQSVLDGVAEAARDRNVDVTWYRRDGHPVGVFRFYADQPWPPTQVRAVRVGDGKVTLAGGRPAGGPAAPAAGTGAD